MPTREHLSNPQPIKPPKNRKLTKTQSRHLERAKESLMRIHMSVAGGEVMAEYVPYDWQLLEDQFRDHCKKQRVTLLVDEPVLKFFRLKGPGYQALVNQVLRSYVELRLSKLIEGPEDRDLEGEPI